MRSAVITPPDKQQVLPKLHGLEDCNGKPYSNPVPILSFKDSQSKNGNGGTNNTLATLTQAPKPEVNTLTLFGLLFAGSVGGTVVTHLKKDLAGSVTKYLRFGFTLLSILFGTVLAAAGLSYPYKDSTNSDINTSGLDIDTDNLTSGDS